METVLKQNAVIAINKDHPLAGKPELSVNDLRGLDILSADPEDSLVGFDNVVDQCRIYGFEPNITRTFTSTEDLLVCVEADLGIAFLDSNTRLSENKNIRIIPLAEAPRSPDLCVAWLKQNSSPVIMEFIHALTGKTQS